MIIWIKYFS